MLVATYEHFSRKELSARLSGSDLNVIDSLVSDDAFESKRESDQMAGELLALCAQRDALPPVALAARYEAIALTAREQTGARLTKAISKLSSEGRAQLREYVDIRITPKVSRTESSSIDLAKSDPEAFLANFNMVCHIQRTGRLPDSMGGQRVISGGEYIDGVSGVKTAEDDK
jgi:hypothetical protein